MRFIIHNRWRVVLMLPPYGLYQTNSHQNPWRVSLWPLP